MAHHTPDTDHSHDHSHSEAEQNEIAGPVLFALCCAVVAVIIIYFWAK